MRIPDANAWWAKRALDAGAHGVMVPLLRDAASVRETVASMKYPPHGIRGFGPMYTHHAFGENCTPDEYRAGAGDLVRYELIPHSTEVADFLVYLDP